MRLPPFRSFPGCGAVISRDGFVAGLTMPSKFAMSRISGPTQWRIQTPLTLS